MKYKVNVEKLKEFCDVKGYMLQETSETYIIDLEDGFGVFFNKDVRRSGSECEGCREPLEIRINFKYDLCEEDECLDEVIEVNLVIDLYKFGAIEDAVDNNKQ